MGKVDRFKKRRDLRENQPESESGHGREQGPGGMSAPAYLRPEKSHQGHQGVGCGQAQADEQRVQDIGDRDGQKVSEYAQDEDRNPGDDSFSSFI